jgi:hypothetical protein
MIAPCSSSQIELKKRLKISLVRFYIFHLEENHMILCYTQLEILVCSSGTDIQEVPRLDGARGSVVVKALCYKPEGHGFNSR